MYFVNNDEYYNCASHTTMQDMQLQVHYRAYTHTHMLDAEPVARPGSPLRSPRGRNTRQLSPCSVLRTFHGNAPAALCWRACVREVQAADGAPGRPGSWCLNPQEGADVNPT
jgi:hypothetical protein